MNEIELLKQQISQLSCRIEKLEKPINKIKKKRNKIERKASSLELILCELLTQNSINRYSIKNSGIDICHLAQPIYTLRGSPHQLDIQSKSEKLESRGGKMVGCYSLSDSSKEKALKLVNTWRLRRDAEPFTLNLS